MGDRGGGGGRGQILVFIRLRTAMQSSDFSCVPSPVSCSLHPMLPLARIHVWMLCPPSLRLRIPSYSSSSPRFHQSRPSLRPCHDHCEVPVPSPVEKQLFVFMASISIPPPRRLFAVRLTPATTSASLTTCVLSVSLPTIAHKLIWRTRGRTRGRAR